MGAELGQNHRCALVTPSLVICNFFVHTIRCVYVVHTQQCLHGPQRTASGSPFFVTLGGNSVHQVCSGKRFYLMDTWPSLL